MTFQDPHACFADNNLSIAADVLIQRVSSWPNLQLLDVRGNTVTPAVCVQFVRFSVASERLSLLAGLEPTTLMLGGVPSDHTIMASLVSFPGTLPALHHMPLVVQHDPQLRMAFARAAALQATESDYALLSSVSEVSLVDCPCLSMTDVEQLVTWFPACEVLILQQSNINDIMLHRFVSGMPQLRTIDVSYCAEVTRIPDALSVLTHLSTVKLQGTAVQLPHQLVSILADEVGTAHARLGDLHVLAFDPCSIDDATIRNLGQLCRNCQHLCLSQCRLSTTGLDAVVESFPQLRILDVTDCGLPALPATLGSLRHLEAVKCMGNSLSDIPTEIVNDPKLVAAYYRASLGDTRVPISYVKLVLAGLGCEGKTTLLRVLQGHPRLVHISDRTRGIDVQTWTPTDHPAWVKHCKGLQPSASGDDLRVPSLTFVVHDLAGQPVYYGTHQRFIAQLESTAPSDSTAFNRALFLVVISLADWGGDRPQRIRLWLDYVHNSCPGAIIVIVGTHLDCVGQPVSDLSWNTDRPALQPSAQVEECKRRMEELVSIYKDWAGQVAAQVSSMMALIKAQRKSTPSSEATLRKLQACQNRPCEAVAAVALNARTGTCLIAEFDSTREMTWTVLPDGEGIGGLQDLMIRTVVTKVDHMRQLVPASWQLLLSAAVPNEAGGTGLKAAFPDGREIIRVPQLRELSQWSRTFSDVQRLEAAVAFGSRMGLVNVVTWKLADYLILHPQWLLDRMSAVQCQIRYWLASSVQLRDLHQPADDSTKFIFHSEMRRIGSSHVEYGQVVARSWAEVAALAHRLYGKSITIDARWRVRLIGLQDQAATLTAMLAQVERFLRCVLEDSKQGIDSHAVREFLQLVGANTRPYWQTGVVCRLDQLTVLERSLDDHVHDEALTTSGTLSWADLRLIWGTASSTEQIIAWKACNAAGAVCCMRQSDPMHADTFIPGMLAWASVEQEHSLPFCGWRPRPGANISSKILYRRFPVKSLPCFLMPQLVRFLYLQGLSLQLRCANAVHVSVLDGEQLLVLIRRDAGNDGGHLVRQVDWSDAGDVCVDFIGWSTGGSGGTWSLFRLALAHVRALLNHFWPGFIVAGVVPIVCSDLSVTMEPVAKRPELCSDVDDTIDDRFWQLDDQTRDPELGALTCILLRDSGEALVRYCCADEAALYQQLRNDEMLLPPFACGEAGNRHYVVWPAVQSTGLARIAGESNFDDAIMCTYQAARCLSWLRQQGYDVDGSVLRHMVKLEEGWRMMLPAANLCRAEGSEVFVCQQLVRLVLSWVLHEEASGVLFELMERARGNSSMLQLVHVATQCIKAATLHDFIACLPVRAATPTALCDATAEEEPMPAGPADILSPVTDETQLPSPATVIASAPILVFQHFAVSSTTPISVLGGGLFLNAVHQVSGEGVLVQLLGDSAAMDSIDAILRWGHADTFFLLPLTRGELATPLLDKKWAIVWPNFEAAFDREMAQALDFQAVVQRANFAARFVQFVHRNMHVIRRPLESTLVLWNKQLRVHPVEAISEVQDIADNGTVYGLYRHDMWRSGVLALRMVRRKMMDADQPEAIAKELQVVASSACYEPQYPLVRWFILPCLDISGDDSMSTNLSSRYDKAAAALQALCAGQLPATDGGLVQLSEEVAKLVSSFQMLSGATGTLTEQFVDLNRVTQQLKKCMEAWMERPLATDKASGDDGSTTTQDIDASSDAAKAYCSHFEVCVLYEARVTLSLMCAQMCWRTSVTYANMVLAGGDVRSDANWKMIVGKAIKFVGNQVQLFPGADAVSSLLSAGFTWAGRRQERQACEKVIAADSATTSLGSTVARLLATHIEHLLEAEADTDGTPSATMSWKDQLLAFGRRVLAEPPKSRIQKLAVAHCSGILALIREGSGGSSAETLVDCFVRQCDPSSANEPNQVKCKRMINVLLDGAATRLWSSSRIVISALTGAINGEDIDITAAIDAGTSVAGITGSCGADLVLTLCRADDLMALARPPPVDEQPQGSDGDDSKSDTQQRTSGDAVDEGAGSASAASSPAPMPPGVVSALDSCADAANVAIDIFGHADADGENNGGAVPADGTDERKHVEPSTTSAQHTAARDDGVVETKSELPWVCGADCWRPQYGVLHAWRPRQLLLERRAGVLVLEISKLKTDNQQEAARILQLQRVVQVHGGARFQVQAFDAESSMKISWLREQEMDQFLGMVGSCGVAVQRRG